MALGLDHVIANMYFIPIAIWNSHPQISVSFYIWKSLIPTTLGNIIGGGVFVGTAYWYLYLTSTGAVEIDFNLGGMNTAMEVGGVSSYSWKHMCRVEYTMISLERLPASVSYRDVATP